MSKVIAIINQKGGVGKTTTTANLAYAFSQKGRDVLVIDFDSQASLTNYLNVGLSEEDSNYYGIYEMLIKDLRGDDLDDEELAGMDFEELMDRCIMRPSYLVKEARTVDGKKKAVDVEKEFGFDLLPSHLILSDYELEISNLPERKRGGNAFRLYNLVQKILAKHPYDYVFIDCNPSLGVMAMMAMVAATDGLIIPTNLDLMSTRGVKNLISRVTETQLMLQESTGGRLQHMGVIGIVLNLYSEKRVVDKTIETDLNRFYPYKIFESHIPESTQAKRALFAGVLYSQMYKKAEEAYSDLASEIELQLRSMEETGPVIQQLDIAGEIGEAYEGEEDE